MDNTYNIRYTAGLCPEDIIYLDMLVYTNGDSRDRQSWEILKGTLLNYIHREYHGDDGEE